MIDDLKENDVVSFGGVERMVSYTTPSAAAFKHPNLLIHDSDPLWLIAELKKPKLPEYLMRGWLERNVTGNYNNNMRSGLQWYPDQLLRDLREAVRQLEAAGVK